MGEYLVAFKEFALTHERTALVGWIAYLGYDLLKDYMMYTLGG